MKEFKVESTKYGQNGRYLENTLNEYSRKGYTVEHFFSPHPGKALIGFVVSREVPDQKPQEPQDEAQPSLPDVAPTEEPKVEAEAKQEPEEVETIPVRKPRRGRKPKDQ